MITEIIIIKYYYIKILKWVTLGNHQMTITIRPLMRILEPNFKVY